MPTRPLHLGVSLPIHGNGEPTPHKTPTEHLTTHGVIVGMTGSGKTGLVLVLVEEALRSQIPVLMIDVKGDLANLCYAFPTFAPQEMVPHLDAEAASRDGRTVEQLAEELAGQRAAGLASWGLTEQDARAFHDSIAPRVITPGTGTAGEMLHVLSALENPSPLWERDVEAARASVAATITLLLRMVGRDPDPNRSRDHVVLSTFAERRLRAGQSARLETLLEDLRDPPVDHIGALPFEEFMSRTERRGLSTALNTLLASPSFEAWRRGSPLDVASWFRPAPGSNKTPAVIVSVAHLDDSERALVLGLLFEELLAWVRTLPGSSALRALVVFDEVYGFLPPHPANPPTKRPLMALLKQARAFGVGIVLATQNPMDLDYRALSNAGVWWVGRLQTDADRERVVEGLAGLDGGIGLAAEELGDVLKNLAPRWFVMRDVHRREGSLELLQTRSTLSWMRGPMTRAEIREAVGASQPGDVGREAAE